MDPNDQILLAVMVWAFLAGLVAWFASSRGHIASEAFFVALMLSPLVGFLIYVLRAPKPRR